MVLKKPHMLAFQTFLCKIVIDFDMFDVIAAYI